MSDTDQPMTWHEMKRRLGDSPLASKLINALRREYRQYDHPPIEKFKADLFDIKDVRAIGPKCIAMLEEFLYPDLKEES